MTAHHDLDRQLNAFLLDGPTSLPDSSFDAVRDRTEQTRQRVVLGPWRVPTLNKLIPIGLGAAALVVALLLGSRFIGSSSPNVGGPGVDPTPTPTQAAPVAEPSSAPEGGLPEGPYVLSAPGGSGPQITLTIPAPGWDGDPTGGTLVKNDQSDPPDGAALIGPFIGEFHVYGDPCQWSTTMPETPATTVDEFVAAMTAQASRDASAPVDITVDGHAGKSVTLHVPDDAVFSECDQGYFGSWGSGGESTPARYHQGPGQIDELWILDMNGELIVLDAMYGAETPAEHVDELRAILGSMKFGK